MSVDSTVVVGAGLAGLSAAHRLAAAGHPVLVLESAPVVGGRTSSWDADGFPVESGLHRVLGVYRELPALMRAAGIDLSRAVVWEDEAEVRTPEGARGIIGAAPLHRPVATAFGPLVNKGLLSAWDVASLVPFFAAGLASVGLRPRWLDTITVSEFASHMRVTQRARRHILEPFTAGIFFLPPERYSAYNFFGLLAPGAPRVLRNRLGAFAGGMTEVMCEPIAAAVERKGGIVTTGSEVLALELDHGVIAGVTTDRASIAARHVIVATELGAAQRLLRPAVGGQPWFAGLLRAPTTPSATIQIDLDRPTLPVDRATFGPGTALASFAEQSRTTFRGRPGRLSAILQPPEEFLSLPPDDVLTRALADARSLGLDVGTVTDFRVVNHPDEFLSLEPGHAHLRPPQRTPVAGLVLAGDYTRQRWLSSMEGAVLSGRLAAEVVLADLDAGT